MWAGMSVASPSQESGDHGMGLLQFIFPACVTNPHQGLWAKERQRSKPTAPVSQEATGWTWHFVLFSQNLATFLGLDYTCNSVLLKLHFLFALCL